VEKEWRRSGETCISIEKYLLHQEMKHHDTKREGLTFCETPGVLTLMIFKDGQMIGRLMGPHPSRLKNEIDKVLTQNGIAVA
jgi:hypothetical protein